jgi:hypothetical protein
MQTMQTMQTRNPVDLTDVVSRRATTLDTGGGDLV